MNILGRLSIFPRIPEPITRLTELAYNLWWSWDADARALFEDIDPALWEQVGHNPVKFQREVSQNKLDAAATDGDYLKRYGDVMARFDAYMNPTKTWFSQEFPDSSDQVIAYFSAEFGLHEALPIYSGGLGILSGDHCKTASDLGLPFIGVGFLYPQGYFTQYINADGWQEARYGKLSFSEVPATPAVGKDGKDVLVKCELPGRDVYAKVWKIQVGRIPLYLMDTDVPQNHPGDRELSARLYGGDQNLRISQEFVLGIGGVRAVRALGIKPVVWHMNEGHSAFMGLERLRELVEVQGMENSEAMEVVRSSTVFTTHTPVPAGHDVFSWDLMDRFFPNFSDRIGLTREEFLELAYQEQTWGPGFSMTVLALHCAGRSNGVAALHGVVSRRCGTGSGQTRRPARCLSPTSPTAYTWKPGSVPTWAALLDQFLPADWRERLHEPEVLNLVSEIPDDQFWQTHQAAKHRLVGFIRHRARQRSIRRGESPATLSLIDNVMDPDALIIGFARRFATYKRATLVFSDMERIGRTLADPERPVQMVFAGKAHPADDAGKAYIQRIVQIAQQPEVWDKIAFIEDYDMNVARYMVQGVDVWLNTPRRPREASGTSGEKAAMNAIPNFSVLDGWWVEGYNGKNGWAIGEERAYRDESVQDEADALSLYGTLENEIIPLYFDRDEQGIPHGWVAVAKEAMRSSLWDFSFRRMLMQYCQQLYVPTALSSTQFAAEDHAVARELAGWKTFITEHWGEVSVSARGPHEAQLTIGELATVTAEVFLGQIERSDVLVEIVHGDQSSGVMANPEDIAMTFVRTDADGVHHFQGTFLPAQTGAHVYGVRVLPYQTAMLNKHEMALAVWAG